MIDSLIKKYIGLFGLTQEGRFLIETTRKYLDGLQIEEGVMEAKKSLQQQEVNLECSKTLNLDISNRIIDPKSIYL